MKNLTRISYKSQLLSMCTVLAISLSATAQSEEVPLWLMDANLAAISIDAYPGSSFKRTLVLPFPNFRLNSPYLQTSGGGVNARIFNSDKVDLGLTMSASIPTKTKELDVRNDRSMPDLDPTFELGLGLKYVPIKTSAWELGSQFPVRKATGIGLADQNELWKIQKPIDLGWTFSPRFTLTRFFQNDGVRHEIDLEFGAKYATQQNMNYFYGVDSQFAIGGEGKYLAEQGLMNTWVELGWVRKRAKWRFSISAEYVDLHDAENLDSPLVEEKDSWVGFIFLTYTFAQSDLMVEQDSEFKN